MKKNILLVQSLCVVATFSSGETLCGEKPVTKEMVIRQDSQPLTKKNRHNKRAKQPAPSGFTAKVAQSEKSEPVIAPATQIEPAIESKTDAPTEDAAPAELTTPAEPTTPSEPVIAPAPQIEPAIESKTDAPAEPTTPTVQPTKQDDAPAPVVRERFAGVLTAISAKAAKSQNETANETITELSALEASVYQPAPTIKQGLGWGDWLKSQVSSNWFVLDAIKAKTFDPENTDHMNRLMIAAENLVLSGDSKNLKELLDACRENYPNIALKKKIALQIDARFKSDEQTTIDEYKKGMSSEEAKLITAHKAIVDKTAALVTTLTKQIEDNADALAKIEADYAFATSKLAATHNKKAADARDGINVLHKLRRDISHNTTTLFDYKSSEYLPLKTGTSKIIAALHEDMDESRQNINLANETIQATLSLLVTSEKPATLQLTDKK